MLILTSFKNFVIGRSPEPRDVSAATISACALYELSMVDKANATRYRAWADTILENLTKNYRATLHADRGFLLLHNTGSAPHNSEVDVPIIYADYFFLEALLRKRNCSLADNQKKTIEETLSSEILKQAAEQLSFEWLNWHSVFFEDFNYFFNGKVCKFGNCLY